MTTSTDIANQAIQLIGNNQPPVTGAAPNFDDSPAGKALKYLYAPTIATVARSYEWDFARSTIALTLTGNVAPLGWAYEYLYPTNGIEVWQIMPATIVDPNDPLPLNFAVGNAVVSGQQQRVILSNVPNARAVYNNNPTEDSWDSTFRESVVRLLADGLAIALAGKPDLAMAMLEQSGGFSSLGQSRQG